MRYVIAVDPGATVGWAIAHLQEHWQPNSIAAGQSTSEDWCDWCEANFTEECLVIVEKFTITARTAANSQEGSHVTIGVIEIMRHVARRTGATFDDSQTPSAAKRFATDAQLKKIGLWKPGQDHARDAIRHLVLGLTTHGTGQAREEMLQSLV